MEEKKEKWYHADMRKVLDVLEMLMFLAMYVWVVLYALGFTL